MIHFGQTVKKYDGDDTVVAFWQPNGGFNKRLTPGVTKANIAALNSTDGDEVLLTGRGTDALQDIVGHYEQLTNLKAIANNTGMSVSLKPTSTSVSDWLRYGIEANTSEEWQKVVEQKLTVKPLELSSQIAYIIDLAGFKKVDWKQPQMSYSKKSQLYRKGNLLLEFFPKEIAFTLRPFNFGNSKQQDAYLKEVALFKAKLAEQFQKIPGLIIKVGTYPNTFTHFVLEHEDIHKKSAGDFIAQLLGATVVTSYGDGNNDVPLLSATRIGEAINHAAVIRSQVHFDTVSRINPTAKLFKTLSEGVQHFINEGILTKR